MGSKTGTEQRTPIGSSNTAPKRSRTRRCQCSNPGSPRYMPCSTPPRSPPACCTGTSSRRSTAFGRGRSCTSPPLSAGPGSLTRPTGPLVPASTLARREGACVTREGMRTREARGAGSRPHPKAATQGSARRRWSWRMSGPPCARRAPPSLNSQRRWRQDTGTNSSTGLCSRQSGGGQGLDYMFPPQQTSATRL